MELFSDLFKKAYIPDEDHLTAADTVQSPKADITDADDEDRGFEDIIPAPEMLSTGELIEPMKAALRLGSAQGMGDWRVFLASRAKKNLREKWKREPQLFNIVWKKIMSVLSYMLPDHSC